MAWRFEFAAAAEADFEIIFDHLFESYISFGEAPEQAFDHARSRVLEIRSDADRILAAPYRGQRHDDLLKGSRNLVIGRASFWFVVDEASQTVRVLAIFFGGQQERQRMMLRLMAKGR